MLAHFRAAGFGPGLLFEEFGVGFDIIDIHTRILHALHIDDEARAEVIHLPHKDGFAVFRVYLFLSRPSGEVKAVSAKVSVVLRRDDRHGGDAPVVPAELEIFTVDRIGAAEPAGRAIPIGLDVARNAISSRVPAELLTKEGNAVSWRQRIPYFYCHHTVRFQMSGLLRNMEEVVDLFLAEHGASIRTLLDDQDWIPVVPVSQITMLSEALMEEDIVTIFEVTQVFKRSTYTARMDTYAIRGDQLVLIATGSITHGYAVIGSRADWSLIEFDDRLMLAVR